MESVESQTRPQPPVRRLLDSEYDRRFAYVFFQVGVFKPSWIANDS